MIEPICLPCVVTKEVEKPAAPKTVIFTKQKDNMPDIIDKIKEKNCQPRTVENFNLSEVQLLEEKIKAEKPLTPPPEPED